MQPPRAPNLRELQRYLGRVGDRWPLQLVLLGGARVADLRSAGAAERGAPGAAERATAEWSAAGRPGLEDRDDRGPEFIVLLVSDGFAGMPWLERVYQASSLWDALEMGDPAEIHCYTAAEYLRRRETAPAVRAVAESGLLLYADSEPFTSATAG